MRNVERVARTRAALIASARKLFAERPFAETSTEALLDGAGVTRGALYHHFEDKTALFEAVCIELSAEAKAAVEVALAKAKGHVDGLERGSIAWLDFMLQPEVRRILLVEAPTVLGWSRWVALDQELSFRLLLEGVAGALEAGELQFKQGAEALAVLLNGALNAMALRLGSEEVPLDRRTGRAAVRDLIRAFATR